jgi:hypothetical protein
MRVEARESLGVFVPKRLSLLRVPRSKLVDNIKKWKNLWNLPCQSSLYLNYNKDGGNNRSVLQLEDYFQAKYAWNVTGHAQSFGGNPPEKWLC